MIVDTIVRKERFSVCRTGGLCLMALICLVVANQASAQGNTPGPEVGVYQGQFPNGGTVAFIALDRFQNVGYVALRSTIACSESVGRLVAVGKGWVNGIEVVVSAVCPDKSERNIRVTVLYDVGTNSVLLRFPAFPMFDGVQMKKIDFPVDTFIGGISELKNDSSWLLLDLLANADREVLEMDCTNVFASGTGSATAVCPVEYTATGGGFNTNPTLFEYSITRVSSFDVSSALQSAWLCAAQQKRAGDFISLPLVVQCSARCCRIVPP